MNPAVVSFPTTPESGEKRLLLQGMAWQDYLLLDKSRHRWGGAKVAYLDGTIELMFPSFEHESRKSLLSYLLEAWLVDQDIEHFHHGSTTLKKELEKAGKEPDESYCFHRQRKLPDLVIEVAITSGGVDTLEIYRRFRIPEVWIWQKERLHAFVLRDEEYVKSTKSHWFPELNLSWLAQCAKVEGGLQARKKFLAGLKRK